MDPSLLTSVKTVLNAKWRWALPPCDRIMSINHFGNIIAAVSDGSVWRILPEELQARRLSSVPTSIDEILSDPSFERDWHMKPLVTQAREKLGPIDPGECYKFKIWPAISGTYSIDNIDLGNLCEWISVSGHVGNQLRAAPEGAKIKLEVIE